MLKRALQNTEILATEKASHSSSKTTKETVSNRYGNSAASKTSSQRKNNCLNQNIAENNSSGSKKVHYVFLDLEQKTVVQKFQQEQQWLPLPKEHHHQEQLQRLQEQEQQLHFEEQRLQKLNYCKFLNSKKKLDEKSRRPTQPENSWAMIYLRAPSKTVWETPCVILAQQAAELNAKEW